MRKKELIAKAELTKKHAQYQNLLSKNKAKIKTLRERLTKERNREQYLRRCIEAIKSELGHQKAGQLAFDLEGGER